MKLVVKLRKQEFTQIEMNYQKFISNLIDLEYSRNSGPFNAGSLIGDLLLSTEGLNKLKDICSKIYEENNSNKESVYLAFLYCISLAKLGEEKKARDIISNMIIESRKSTQIQKFSKNIASKELFLLSKFGELLTRSLERI